MKYPCIVYPTLDRTYGHINALEYGQFFVCRYVFFNLFRPHSVKRLPEKGARWNIELHPIKDETEANPPRSVAITSIQKNYPPLLLVNHITWMGNTNEYIQAKQATKALPSGIFLVSVERIQ